MVNSESAIVYFTVPKTVYVAIAPKTFRQLTWDGVC